MKVPVVTIVEEVLNVRVLHELLDSSFEITFDKIVEGLVIFVVSWNLLPELKAILTFFFIGPKAAFAFFTIINNLNRRSFHLEFIFLSSPLRDLGRRGCAFGRKR